MKKLLLLIFFIGLYCGAKSQILPGNTVTKYLYAYKWVGTDTANPRNITKLCRTDTIVLPSGEKFWILPDTGAIYLSLNNKIDSAAFSGDSLRLYSNTVLKYQFDLGAITINIPTLLQVNGIIDLKRDYGADSTNTTDISAVFQAALNTGRPVYIGDGTFKLDNTIQVPDSAYIFGNGVNTKIMLADGITGLEVGNFCTIKGLSFRGTRDASSDTAQTAILLDSTSNNFIFDCNFSKIAGNGIRLSFLQYKAGGTPYAAGMIQNCFGDSNHIGILYDVRGEYLQTSNCVFSNNDYGIFMRAGNAPISDCIFSGNTYGFYFNGTGGQNVGHSVASGLTLNHNKTSIYMMGNGLGYNFIGCMGYFGDLQVDNTDNVVFSDCQFQFAAGADTLRVTRSTNTAFVNCTFPVMATSLVFDTSKVVYTSNRAGEFRVSDLDDAKTFSIYPDSNRVTMRGSGGLDTLLIPINIKTTGTFGVNTPVVSAGRATTFRDVTGENEILDWAGGSLAYGRNSSLAVRLNSFNGTVDAKTSTLPGNNIGLYSLGGYRGTSRVDAFEITGTARDTFSTTVRQSSSVEFTKIRAGEADKTIMQYFDTLNRVSFGYYITRPILSYGFNIQRTFAILKDSLPHTVSTSLTNLLALDTATGQVYRQNSTSLSLTGITATTATLGAFTIASNTIVPAANGFIGLGSGRSFGFANSGFTNTMLSINEYSPTATSGTPIAVALSGAFNPSSGSAPFVGLHINHVINQTGSATGTTYGVRINDAVTSGANYYAFAVERGKAAIRDSLLLTKTPVGLAGDSILVKDDSTGLVKVIPQVVLANGTYTPTIDTAGNLDTITVYDLHYTRMGTQVSVTGQVDVHSVTGAGTLTKATVSLPIASNFTSVADCSGLSNGIDVASSDSHGGIIIADVAGDKAIIQYIEPSAGSHTITFTFTYTIK